MTPEIAELLRRADDAMTREAWAEVAKIYFQLANMFKDDGAVGRL